MEVAADYVGVVVELMGKRRGTMLNMAPGFGSLNVLKNKMPTRGLLGLRNHLLTVTKDSAILHTIFSAFNRNAENCPFVRTVR